MNLSFYHDQPTASWHSARIKSTNFPPFSHILFFVGELHTVRPISHEFIEIMSYVVVVVKTRRAGNFI